jgi:hypothetical protein
MALVNPATREITIATSLGEHAAPDTPADFQ